MKEMFKNILRGLCGSLIAAFFGVCFYIIGGCGIYTVCTTNNPIWFEILILGLSIVSICIGIFSNFILGLSMSENKK